MLFTDLHTHSHYSDGVPSPDQIEDHCQRKALGIALTDHNEIRGSIRLLERDRVPCIPGIEVGTGEGLEFLVYFPTPQALEQFFVRAVEPLLMSRFMVRSKIKAVPCLDIARELGAFISLAHPYAFGRKSLEHHKRPDGKYRHFVYDVIDRIDAVEHFNGGVPRGVNEKARNLHQDLEKRITAGSDSHRIATYGSVGLHLSAEMRSRGPELFQALSDGGRVGEPAGEHSSILLSLPIIMYKHTKFFLLNGAPRRNGRRKGTRKGS